MIVEVTADGVRLVAPDDVRGFHIDLASGVDLAAALHEHGWGTLADDDDHAWVSIGAVRRAAVGNVDADWDESFDGMLAYAGTKGWLDADGTHIKAHVERRS